MAEGTQGAAEFGLDSTVRRAAWDALSVDPTIGVTLVRDDGLILWCNEQAARLWKGAQAKASDYIGLKIRDIQPAEWAKEREETYARVKASGQPLVVRNIWNGKQLYSLMRPIKGSLLEHDRFLIITRHVPMGETMPDPTASTFDLVDSRFVELGHLDVLTARELEILALIGQGMSSREIASVLGRSEKTIENHRYAISRKLESSSPVRLSEIARQAGLTVKDAERQRVR